MKTLFLSIIILCTGGVFAAKIQFQKFPGLDKALKMGEEAGKPILIDTYADWCGWCKYMDNNIFNDEEVATYFNENFIAFKVDADASSSTDFTYQYDISGLPCILILDEKGETLNRSDGAITDVEEFVEFGQMAYYVLYPETSPWYKNQQKFDAGERSPSFLREYAISMVDGDYTDEEMDEIVDLYWSTVANDDLTDEDNFELFFIFNYKYDDALVIDFLNNQEAISDAHGEETFYDKCFYIVLYNLTDAIDNDDQALYEKTVEFTKKYLGKNQDYYDGKELLSNMKDLWNDR